MKITGYIVLSYTLIQGLKPVNAQLFPIQKSDFNRPFGGLIGSWAGNPQFQFNSVNVSHNQSGFAKQAIGGFYADLYCGFREKWSVGFTFQTISYMCDTAFIRYHLGEDWNAISHKIWENGSYENTWNVNLFGFKVSREFVLSKSGKWMAGFGGTAGVLYMRSPRFDMYSDLNFSYNHNTSLTIESKYSAGPMVGIHGHLGANIGNAFHLRFGLDGRYGVANFYSVPFSFTDNTDISNPGKVDNFNRRKTFQQQYSGIGFFFLFGFHIL
ncbi:MAG: hypothetical protein KG003_08680 [Bacteroidetes bacterium]|nr:hypothetical protein [Bacteroidota bacterium]